MRVIEVHLTEEQYEALGFSERVVPWDELQQRILSLRALESLSKLQDVAAKHGLDRLTEAEIESEIDASRREKNRRS